METLYDVFVGKYPQNGIIANKWKEATNTNFNWEHLTKINFTKFADYLCDNMSQSSARQYMAKFKAVLEIYSDEIELPRQWRKCLSVKDDKSQQTYLTENEIMRIIRYKACNKTESIVQQQFILGCLTGARHGDYSKFTQANIHDNKLVYVSQKTHIKAELPLSETARMILFAEGDMEYPLAYKEVVSDHTFNDTIRSICKKCDISQTIHLYRRGEFWTGEKYWAVSSHTSRRSFCTNLYLRCRDVYLVSKLAGHTSTAMSERYICCSTEALTQQAMDYFKQF